jgi:hypothetical protein
MAFSRDRGARGPRARRRRAKPRGAVGSPSMRTSPRMSRPRDRSARPRPCRRRDEDAHALGDELVEERPQLATADRIDAVRRLVEDEDLRSVKERAGDRELLVHAARERARGRVRGRARAALWRAARSRRSESSLRERPNRSAEEPRGSRRPRDHRRGELLRHVAEVTSRASSGARLQGEAPT